MTTRNTKVNASGIGRLVHRPTPHAPHAPPLTRRVPPSRPPQLVDFKAALKTTKFDSIEALKADVEAFASQFPTIGFDESSMKYP